MNCPKHRERDADMRVALIIRTEDGPWEQEPPFENHRQCLLIAEPGFVPPECQSIFKEYEVNNSD